MSYLRNSALQFGQMIKRLRENRNLSIEETAQKANISPKMLYRIEIGYYSIRSFDLVGRIEKSLGANLGSLISCMPIIHKERNPLPIFMRSIRKVKGLKQREASYLIRTSPTYLCSIEKGRTCPNSKWIKRWSEVMECRVPDEFVESSRHFWRENKPRNTKKSKLTFSSPSLEIWRSDAYGVGC